jgi:hypothetical protein
MALVEQLGKPAVVIVNHNYLADARTAASVKGVPTLRLIPETIPSNSTVAQEIEDGVDAVMQDIVAGLTRPLTPEEQNPPPKKVEPTSGIVFKGSWKEVNRFFYKRGWTDGLPVAPPTEEEVAEMLAGTDLAPDHVIGKIVPRLGKATVEKIAVNAVMAGCLPTYMPVLIAATEILLDPRIYWGQMSVSTSAFAPMWILNGPMRKDLHLNCKTGVLSPGDVSNSTIGRAMHLIIKNIGGIRKGVEDMGVIGNVGKLGMVIGEDEESSPWTPLHVDHGFQKEDNALTVHFMNNSQLISPYHTDDNGIVSTITYNINPGRQVVYLIVINGETSRYLTERGWSKQDIREYISEYARVPGYQHRLWERVVTENEPNPWGVRRQQMAVHPMESVRIIQNPDWIRVVVAGGPIQSIGIFGGDHFDKQAWVTRKIQVPANWDKLVGKYKNVVHNYAFY